MTQRIDITDYGAISGGEVLCTTAIQNAIDKAAERECEVYVPKGTYLTGALFLKSNMSLHLAKGAVLLGTPDESAYPVKRSCMADIEMDCPTGIINVFQASHVRIYGAGVIDGQGDSCRKCNVIVHDCYDVQLEDFHSMGSGCGNMHISYSENVRVKGLAISDNSNSGADGIAVASCNGVLVEQCRISCKHDNVCIKTGRDADGLSVNRICENIMVRGCDILEGGGIALSTASLETMRNISICDNVFRKTRCGFRMKSAGTKGGLIEEVTVENLKMENVRCCFCFEFSGYPADSNCEIPHARKVRISKVTSTISEGYQGNAQAFAIDGLPEAPFEDFVFEDMQLQAKEYGTIANVKKLLFHNVAVDIVV